jgi:hypothetical protein
MRHRRLSLLATLSVALLGGCAMHQSGPFVPSTQQASQVPPAVAFVPLDASPDKVPPDCKGQKSFPKYATDAFKLSTKGGKLCIPAFGGFGGTIAYPAATPSITLTLTSSTTNYTGKLAKLHSGTPLFYLQIASSGAVTFGATEPAGGGLTGANIVVGKPYTVYAQAVVNGIPFNFTPCYTVATKGPYGGVIGGVGTPLEGQVVPFAATGVVEIYAGQSATGKC